MTCPCCHGSGDSTLDPLLPCAGCNGSGVVYVINGQMVPGWPDGRVLELVEVTLGVRIAE